MITSTASNVILQWGLQGGHGVGTTIQYSFQVSVGPSLPSGTYPVSIQTLISAIQTCGASASTCNTFYSTGTATVNLIINRPTGLWTGNIDTD